MSNIGSEQGNSEMLFEVHLAPADPDQEEPFDLDVMPRSTRQERIALVDSTNLDKMKQLGISFEVTGERRIQPLKPELVADDAASTAALQRRIDRIRG